MQPLVSVVIPTYNQAAFLSIAIDSVLAQEYKPLELIVINDGSTDSTREIVDRYRGSIKVIHQLNSGASVALNRGIRESKGEFVCWLSSDDRFLSGKVQRQVEYLASEPAAAMSWTAYYEIDVDGRRIRYVSTERWLHPDLFVGTFWSNPVNGSSVMIRRSVLDELGLFNEALQADVDCDMWLRVFARHRAGHGIDEPLLEYRIHPGMMSRRSDLMADSMTKVRLARLESGELERALSGEPGERADWLAKMSAWFAIRGLLDVATALAQAAERSAANHRPRVRLAVSLWLARRRRIHGAMLTLFKAIRGGVRVTRRPR